MGIIDSETIDEINVLQATRRAMMTAAVNADDMLKVRTGSETGIKLLLLDAVRIDGVDIPQKDIIKGDAKSLSIAASSIIAKVTRDRIMNRVSQPVSALRI